MRGRPEGQKSYIDFLWEIKETCLRAYKNQEYPFEELVEDVDVKRDIARNPLFDVMLVLQNNEEAQYELNGIDIGYVILENRAAKFDLTFNICEDDDDIAVELEYCTALYKEEHYALFVLI